MTLYCGIDLHSNNHYLTIIDENDKRLYEKRLSNDIEATLRALQPFSAAVAGIAVESTFNWYWLVDGLMDHGYEVHLVNTAALQQYEGLKHTNDRHDAFWLAHQLRLGILPEGYIYPRAQRALRDLFRKRHQLMQDRVTYMLRAQSLVWRTTGVKHPMASFKKADTGVLGCLSEQHDRTAVQSLFDLIETLNGHIAQIDTTLSEQLRTHPAFARLCGVYGIGPVLAKTILCETGEIQRFKNAGHYASYCRCVNSAKTSNGKKKGVNNAKNGNPYLAWAFIEAAHFAARFYPKARQFYQRKVKQRNALVARKALAHKLSRACFYVMRDNVAFAPERLFH